MKEADRIFLHSLLNIQVGYLNESNLKCESHIVQIVSVTN